jgi:hypothetical protein
VRFREVTIDEAAELDLTLGAQLSQDNLEEASA